MIVALFANLQKNHSVPIAKGICDFFNKRKVKVVTEDSFADKIGATPLFSVDPKSINFIISLGGDGTILRVFHTHPELDAPILGINMGGLGFMADIPVEEINASLENLLDGNFKIQERIMMEGISSSQKTCFAINEITVHRAQNPSLIDLALYVDGNYLNTFSADGIIISTPNGSTAYSLAAGGPILTPELEAFVITPICAHTISNRPVVLMPKKEIQVRYLSESEAVEVNYDGFAHFPLYSGEVFRIIPSKRKFRSLHMPHYDFFATLRTKLGWTGRLKK